MNVDNRSGSESVGEKHVVHGGVTIMISVVWIFLPVILVVLVMGTVHNDQRKMESV